MYGVPLDRKRGPGLLRGHLVGAVSTVDEYLSDPNTGLVCMAHSKTGDLAPVLGGDLAPVLGQARRHDGAGCAFSRVAAYSAALAEALERTCLWASPTTPLFRTSVARLTDTEQRHVAPSQLACYLDTQYEDSHFHLDRPPAQTEECYWLNGLDLVTGEDVAVPAEYCVWLDGYRVSGARWYDATSNGVGAAATPQAACLSGVLELLERDAFMVMWHHRLTLPHISLDGAGSARLRELVRSRVERSGLSYRLIDLTDIHQVPAVIAVVWGEVCGQRVHGIGSAAAGSLTGAVRKALSEAVGQHSQARAFVVGNAANRLSEAEVFTFRDHTMFYLDPANEEELALLIDDERPVRAPSQPDTQVLTSEPTHALRALARHLRSRQVDTVAVDLSPVDADYLGIYVYKVVSAQLLPLNAPHPARYLGHPRLRADPDGRPVAPFELNPAPHPLA